VGAHSFVNKDVPANSTAYGVPIIIKKVKWYEENKNFIVWFGKRSKRNR
jgi:serine acetyltransferase